MTWEATPVVRAMEGLPMWGHITPFSWYEYIRLPNGKTDLGAIAVLSELVYWYRPAKDGGRKFKADKLQRSYKQLAAYFHESVKWARRVVKRLEEQGYITRELRTIQCNGRAYSNVLFLEVVPERIIEITKDGRGG